jgi:hypothetical protein
MEEGHKDTVAIYEILKKLGACNVAGDWLEEHKTEDLQILWDTYPRGDHLLWIAGKAGIQRTRLVYAACQCARLALPYVREGELRPFTAIETTEAWTRGEASIEQVRKDRDAAYAYAAHAAAYAAHAAAYAYAADAAHAAAYDAARKAMQQKCADTVRQHITLTEVLDALEASQ